MAGSWFSVLPHCLPLPSAESQQQQQKLLSAPANLLDAYTQYRCFHKCPCVCVYMCVSVTVCVCIFRVTERVGVDNQERSYISLLHNEPLLWSGYKRKNKKVVSHLWHIYLDRGLTQSHSLPCWDILVTELWGTKWCPQCSLNGFKACPITAIALCWHFPSALRTHLYFFLNWVWRASDEISHFISSCLRAALNVNDQLWGQTAAHEKVQTFTVCGAQRCRRHVRTVTRRDGYW